MRKAQLVRLEQLAQSEQQVLLELTEQLALRARKDQQVLQVKAYQ